MGEVVDLKMAAAGDETLNPDAPQFTFEDFWKLYPRRLAKKDARTAWDRIPEEIRHKIFAAVERAKKTEDWKKNGGQYVPYPASYLRGERWEDEIEGDLTMGQCDWNRNGTREPGKPRCTHRASKEKNGTVYCSAHANMVN